ncbi:MAG TPA: hypothetical protein VF525_04850, partial [Pyrinomonadaceae bacterium]
GLFGEAAGAQQQTNEQGAKPGAGQQAETPAPVQAANVQQLIQRANQQFNDYQRLTAEGKLAEAGQKLEALKQTLNELQKASSAGQAKPVEMNR